MELVESNAPEEWQESYINRITSLKSFEVYIIETMVMAEFLLSDDGDFQQKDDLLDKIEKFKEESIQYAQMANSAKP
jgi:ADP-glucose pyrophosphorylase